MSIEFSGSNEAPRNERVAGQEQIQVQTQQAGELQQDTADKVRAVLESQQAENQQKRELRQDEIQQVAATVANMAQSLNRELQFSVNKDIDETVITVLDRNTGEMVRQIPSEEIVRLAERMNEYNSEQLDSATGLLFDSQA